jgi:hypothetical protein
MGKNFVLSHICLNLAIGIYFGKSKKSKSVKLNLTHAGNINQILDVYEHAGKSAIHASFSINNMEFCSMEIR